MMLAWKSNWEESRRHFIAWWRREGLVLGCWAPHPAADPPHESVTPPPPPSSAAEAYTRPRLRAQRNHHHLAHSAFPADVLGCEPGIDENTVWFDPCWADVEEPESLPPLAIDPGNRWWRLTEETLLACVQQAGGKYMVGCPDLVENIDILAALREPQLLLLDMIERPQWVEAKVWEIHEAWCEAYRRIYDLIKLPDGSSCFGAFRVWGPGRTAKVQCDASAMFSPAMFQRFVVPALTAQCAWLDHSMYHLDGTQAVCHLDALLAIKELDAIEWTPQAGIEGGGHPRWHAMYRKILEAGKSLQIVGATPDELAPLLDAIGGRGVYILGDFADTAEIERAATLVDAYRG